MVKSKILKNHPRKTSLVKFSFPGLSSIKNYFRKYKMVSFSFYLSNFCNLIKIGRYYFNFFLCYCKINSSICKKFAGENSLTSYKLEKACIFANKTIFEKSIWLKFVEVGSLQQFSFKNCLQWNNWHMQSDQSS